MTSGHAVVLDSSGHDDFLDIGGKSLVSALWQCNMTYIRTQMTRVRNVRLVRARI